MTFDKSLFLRLYTYSKAEDMWTKHQSMFGAAIARLSVSVAKAFVLALLLSLVYNSYDFCIVDFLPLPFLCSVSHLCVRSAGLDLALRDPILHDFTLLSCLVVLPTIADHVLHVAS